MSDEQRWDEFIGWAAQFRAWSGFDDQLRSYKLNIVAPALQKAREAVRRDQGNWPSLLREACQLSNRDRPRKDLPNSSYYGRFVRWCDTDPVQARSVLLALWDERLDPVERVRGFMVTMTAVRERLNEKVVYNNMFGMQASFLLLGEDPCQLPMYRDDPFDLAYRLITGSRRERSHPGDSGEVYRLALSFLDQFTREASARGLELRDRLDAQSLVWCVTSYEEEYSPVCDWPKQEQDALLEYRASGKTSDRRDNAARGETDIEPHDQEPAELEEAGADGNAVWMFQFNPDHYDLERHVREHGPIDWWKANQARDRMRLGQRVYFMRAGGQEGGAHAAIVAVGRIVREAYSAPPGADHEYREDVLYDAQAVPPLQREPDLRGDAVLRGYYALREGQPGTNFRLPPDVAQRLDELMRDRLRPFASTELDLGTPVTTPDLDARTRVVAEVVRRWGQSEFRQQLLDAYEGRCAVTGCDAVEALEAAHIAPYRGPHTNIVSNGLLLRADIHTLFDLGLMAIDTGSMTVLLAPSLSGTTYSSLAGQPLRLPADAAQRPDIAALDEHRRQSTL